MKAFLAAAALTLVSTFAMANSNEQINWPSVNGLAVNNACATFETFESINDVRQCGHWGKVSFAVSNQGQVGMVKRRLADGESPRIGEFLQVEDECTAYVMAPFSASRWVTTQECSDYPTAGERYNGCKNFESKTILVGREFSVEKIVHHGDVDQSSYFTYVVPFCE